MYVVRGGRILDEHEIQPVGLGQVPEESSEKETRWDRTLSPQPQRPRVAKRLQIAC